MQPIILIVEDEKDMSEGIKIALSVMNYSIVQTSSGKEAVSIVKTKKPNLIILDLGLPDMDGLEVCKTIRADEETRSIPILMLTARTTLSDIVSGLQAGANDYIKKPFESLELIARVQAQLKYLESLDVPQTVIEREGIKIDHEKKVVLVEGREIKDLTSKEFDVLYELLKNAPGVVRREDIAKAVWGETYNEGSRVIDNHVQKLREKLGSRISSRLISIRGEGYRFV